MRRRAEAVVVDFTAAASAGSMGADFTAAALVGSMGVDFTAAALVGSMGADFTAAALVGSLAAAFTAAGFILAGSRLAYGVFPAGWAAGLFGFYRASWWIHGYTPTA